MFEITLSTDLAYQDKVENPSEMEESFFSDIYKNAANNLVDIISADREIKENENKFSNILNDFSKYNNNIIAFTGDRGTGKSSALKSFVNMLLDTKATYFNNNKYLKTHLNGVHFEGIPIIDPSQLKDQEGILDSVLANMYTKVKKYIEESHPSFDCECKNMKRTEEILKSFNDTFDSLSKYRKKSDENMIDLNDTPLENLDKFSSSNQLKKNLQKTVDLYLREYRKDNNNDSHIDDCDTKDRYLIIAIDDLDMNIDNGFKIAEEIRKFLMIPKVIVVIALNVDQFAQLVKREYLGMYEKMIKNEMMKTNDISKIAEKYITKLLPVSRRNSMPASSLRNVTLYTVNLEEEQKKENLVDFFLCEIYKKTGLLLLKNASGTHEIIPDTLRGIQQLYALLKSMEDVDLYDCIEFLNINDPSDPKKAGQSAMKANVNKNIDIFYDYLMRECFAKHLGQNKINIIEGLQLIPNIYINKFIIKNINGYLPENKKVTMNLIPENYSIGDVLNAIKTLQSDKIDSETQTFCEALRIIYSIRLIQTLFVPEFNTEEEMKKTREEARTLLGESIFIDEQNRYISMNIKGLEEQFSTYCGLNQVVSRYNNIDHDECYYKSIFNSGSTNYVVIDLSAFILNLIDIDLIKNRVRGANFIDINGFKNYSDHNITAIPIWSIDFVDNLINKFSGLFKNVGKDKNDSRFPFDNVLKTFSKCLDQIIKENSQLSKITIKSYENKNLSDMILSNFNDVKALFRNKDKDSIDLINYVLNLGLAQVANNIAKNDNLILKVEDFLKNDLQNNAVEAVIETGKDCTKTKPRYLQLFGVVFRLKNWSEVLVKTIEVLINTYPKSYDNIVKECKNLSIDSVSKKDKQMRKPLDLSKDIFPEQQYTKVNFNANTVVDLCKNAIQACGKVSQGNFEVFILIKNNGENK